MLNITIQNISIVYFLKNGNNRRFLITKKLSSKSVHLKELRKHLGNISLLTVNLYSTIKVEQEMEKRKKHHETLKDTKKCTKNRY